MDIAQIKSILMTFLQRARTILKSVTSLPFFKTYLVLSFFLIIIFIIITFPYGELIMSRLKKSEGTFKSVDIGYLDVGFFGETTAESVTFLAPWGNEINIQSVILDGNINPYSLLVSKDYNGKINLKNLSYVSERVSFDSSITCDYELKFKPDGGTIEKGKVKTYFESATLKLTDIELPAGAAGLKISLPLMKFKLIDIEAMLGNDVLTIQKMKFSGPDLNCSIAGTIRLAGGMANSQLDLAISIESDSPAIEKYKDFLGSFANADGDIVLNLTGNLSRPSFGKKGGGESEATETGTDRGAERRAARVRNRSTTRGSERQPLNEIMPGSEPDED